MAAAAMNGHYLHAFGRERTTLHAALGGRRAADVILWRDKAASACILAAATAAWGLFEVAEYHLVTVACYVAMVAMLVSFVWTNASAFFNMDRWYGIARPTLTAKRMVMVCLGREPARTATPMRMRARQPDKTM
ncbi:Reticulon-like protein B9, partial [Zea mays]